MTWPTKKLTDLCDLERGTEPGSAFYVGQSTKTTPFFRVGDLTGKVDALKFVANDNGNLQIVDENEILITFDGTPGIVVRGLKGAIASGIRVIRNVNPEVNGGFLFYSLQTPQIQKTIKAYSKGATIIHASTAIPHLKIPLPPLKTQKQIVERLDKIVAAQKLNDGLIQKTDELFQSVFYEQLSGKEKWDRVELSQVGEIITGTTPSTKKPEYWSGRHMWATPFDMNNDTVMLENTNRKLSDLGYKKIRAVPKNSIMVTCIGATIGKMAMAKEEMATNQQINTIICNKSTEPFFVFCILKSMKRRLVQLGKTTAVPIINKSEFGRLEIPLPPLKTQKQIAAKLSAVQNYKTQLLAQKSKLKELFNSALAKSMKN